MCINTLGGLLSGVLHGGIFLKRVPMDQANQEVQVALQRAEEDHIV